MRGIFEDNQADENHNRNIFYSSEKEAGSGRDLCPSEPAEQFGTSHDAPDSNSTQQPTESPGDFSWTERQRVMRNITKIGLALALAGVAGLPAARADEVTDWNLTTENAIKTAAVNPGIQGRFLAIVHTAVYDAVNGIVGKYTPYFVTESAPPGARPEAAAVQAAYTALKALFPAQTATFDAQLAESLANIPGGDNSLSILRGRAWGEHVANLILAWRATDGFSTPPPPYFGDTNTPGIWRSIATGTNADGTLPAVFPQMAVLVPFAMTSHSQFRAGPPPALDSAQYAADVNEVKAIGRFDSAIRTPEQTQLALLWQASGAAEENRIARSVMPPDNELVDNARLFALLNIVACDTIISAFDAKYTYNLWRPYHAIRLADTDGNPDTEPDTTWDSLFLAPRHQEYFSAHAVNTGGIMHVLARELGDEHTFTLVARDYPSFTWTFARFSDAAAQVKEARIWAGIHYRNSCDVGEAVGLRIADYVLDHFLLSLDDEGQQ